MASALASTPLPVKGNRPSSRTACNSPPSPSSPWRTRNARCASLTAFSRSRPGTSSRSRAVARSASGGGLRPTRSARNSPSRSGPSSPCTVSTAVTSCPATRSARRTSPAPASATSRSGVEPPVISAMRKRVLVAAVTASSQAARIRAAAPAGKEGSPPRAPRTRQPSRAPRKGLRAPAAGSRR